MLVRMNTRVSQSVELLLATSFQCSNIFPLVQNLQLEGEHQNDFFRKQIQSSFRFTWITSVRKRIWNQGKKILRSQNFVKKTTYFKKSRMLGLTTTIE